ncbi:MAG: TldD/PmbA family protein [Verrucomicrobiales bacterium]|nr:TldD/PmbA family protein [Verrucomicrobiae bacterium]MCP5554621.1 TldD/PmbA family protein [Akkermansiaceae bacterium]
MDLTEDTARDLTRRLLDRVNADHATVEVGSAKDTNVRFANNEPTSNGAVTSLSISLSVSFGRRSASVGFDQTDDATLDDAVRRVEAMARLAPENPELLPPPGPAKFDPAVCHANSTEQAGPEALAGWLKPAVARAREAGVNAAGYLDCSAGVSVLATSTGMFVFERYSDIGFSMTARTAEGKGSGWASLQATAAEGLDLEPVARRAIQKALDSRNPRPLEPGRRTVILEPAAVRDLISLLLWSLDRRDFDEGRSFLNPLVKDGDPVGQALFGDKAVLWSDPLDLRAPCGTNAGGLPRRRTSWIESGVLKNLTVGRFWAKQKKVPPLPGPGNFFLEGEGRSMEELIASVDDGVLVTRLWYLRMVDPQTLLYTGLTRDGTFRIEKGQITGPVVNFRFNESTVNVLRNLLASGIPERVLGSEDTSPALVPALVVKDFNLSSVSEAS